MIITKELSDAAVEVLALLDNVSNEIFDKVPTQYIEYLKEIESYDYDFEYNPNKKLDEQNFSEQALKMIGLLYQDYLCDEEQKEDYIRLIQNFTNEQEEEKRKKYNPDDIFKKSSQEPEIEQDVPQENVAMIEYKESILKKVINKIKNFFHIN